MGLPSDAQMPLAVVSLLVAAVFGIVCSRCGKRGVAVVLSCLAAGAALGFSHVAQLETDANEIKLKDGHDVEVFLLEDMRASNDRLPASCTALATFEDGSIYRVSFTGDLHEQCYFGEQLVGRAHVASVDDERLGRLAQKGLCGRLRLDECSNRPVGGIVGSLVDFRIAAINALAGEEEPRALLAALVCGYRNDFSDSSGYNAFQTCGLAHMVAVSGAHLVIVTGMFACALQALHVRRRITVAMLIMVMLSYLVVAGMPVSALRACIMSSVGLLALIARRRPSSLNGIGIGVFAIIFHDPSAALSVSLALSVLSTLGIVLFAPLIETGFMRITSGRGRFLVSSTSLCLASNTMAGLYGCSLFGRFPLVGPLANIVVGPLFAPACAMGLLGAVGTAMRLPISDFFIGCALALCKLMLKLASALSCMPFAAIPIDIGVEAALTASFILAVILWLAWENVFTARAIACAGLGLIAIFALHAMDSQRDEIIMLDVGQGDAIVVKSKGQSLLVDTGNKDSMLLKGVASHTGVHLGAVLVTHGDDDHCGSLPALASTVSIGTVMLARETFTCGDEHCTNLVDDAREAGAEVLGLGVGDSFSVGRIAATVVWPSEFRDSGGNADSLCLLLEYDGDEDGRVDVRALLTGDAEHEQLEQMIRSGAVGDIDILKVGHHGSKAAVDESVLHTLDPQVALVSVGASNRYGHPAPETLEALQSAGAKVYRTDEDGEVRCMLSEQGVVVSTKL